MCLRYGPTLDKTVMSGQCSGIRSQSWRRHRRWVALAIGGVVALAVGTLVTTSGGSRNDLALYNPYGNLGGLATPDVRPGMPYVYVLFPLCTKGDPVTITRVTPHAPVGEITVVDWSAQESAPFAYADGVPGRAQRLLHEGSSTVDWTCVSQNDKHSSTFAVSVRIDSGYAVANGFDIHSDGGSVFVPVIVVECTADYERTVLHTAHDCPMPKNRVPSP